MAYRKKTKEEIQAELNDLSTKIEKGVEEVFTSGRYMEYLRMMAKFPKYSANNCMLIMMQRPTAKYVCGYVTWKKEFHRHVIYGETGLSIIGGKQMVGKKIVKDEHGNETEETFNYTKYFPCYVFADDQTDGDPLPELCKELKTRVDGYATVKAKLQGIAKVPVCFEDFGGEAKGYFSPSENRIVVRVGMPESQTIKTMVHEMTHSVLHCKDGRQAKADRDTKEIQAESVAFIVCHYLGIETDDYSFPYLASWANEKGIKAVRENLDIIKETATDIISHLTDL